MRLKKIKEYKLHGITLRCKLTQKHQNQRKANLYTEGNVSEWILYAAINHVPKRSDLEK